MLQQKKKKKLLGGGVEIATGCNDSHEKELQLVPVNPIIIRDRARSEGEKRAGQ